MHPQLEAQIKSLLQQGQKLEAIKLLRSRTGMDLAQAKAAVEALNSPENSASDTEIEATVRDLVQKGQAIQAIQYVRKATGSGLKESKEYVDFFVADQAQAQGLPTQPRRPTWVAMVVGIVLMAGLFLALVLLP